MVDWVGVGIGKTIKEKVYRVAVPTAEETTSYEGQFTVEQIINVVKTVTPVQFPVTGQIFGGCLT